MTAAATLNLTFYQASATLLPLIYIGIVYQARAWQSHTERLDRAEWTYQAAVAMTLLIGVGEVQALGVLASGHPSTAKQRGIAVVLITAGGYLLSLPIWELASARDVASRADGGRGVLFPLALAATFLTTLLGVLTEVHVL